MVVPVSGKAVEDAVTFRATGRCLIRTAYQFIANAPLANRYLMASDIPTGQGHFPADHNNQ